MFKYYLTYQFAVSFHQLCHAEDRLEPSSKERLLRSAELMLQSFTKGIHARSADEEGLQMFTTLINLRDCRDLLKSDGIFEGDYLIKFDLIHGRMERICESLAREQDGQLRMLG